MGLFGEASPKFISGGTEVLLDYAQPIVDEPEWDVLEEESSYESSGERVFYNKGYHWVYECIINLHRYDDPEAKFLEIYPYLGAEVTLYRHRDKDPVQDSDGNVVLFFIEEIIPMYLDGAEWDLRDRLLIRFKSLYYVDISKSTKATLITEVEGFNIITEQGGENIIAG